MYSNMSKYNASDELYNNLMEYSGKYTYCGCMYRMMNKSGSKCEYYVLCTESEMINKISNISEELSDKYLKDKW